MRKKITPARKAATRRTSSRYRQRMAERGLKQVALYVPEDRVDSIKQIAADMAEYPNLMVWGWFGQDAGGCIEGGDSPPMRAEPAPDGQDTSPEARGQRLLLFTGRLASGSKRHLPSKPASECEVSDLSYVLHEGLALIPQSDMKDAVAMALLLAVDP